MNKIKILKYLQHFKFSRLIYYKVRHKKYLNFSNLNLNENSLVLDFGANIGEISQYLVDLYNCEIHSYEPNKHAFKILDNRLKNIKKIKCYNKAVSIDNGVGNLYHHKLNRKNPIAFSTGSSLLKNKENVDSNNYDIIEKCSVKDILDQFKMIDLIKIDIEGFEYEILPTIIDNKNKIKKVICELHGNPEYSKSKFLNKEYSEFIKKLYKIDPQKKWFLHHF